MNSLARCPCVTITPPTRRTGSVLAGCESITFISFPRIQTLPSSFLSDRRALAHITVYRLRVKAGALQSSGDLIRYHYRTVTSAGAANSHGQIRFAFALILRQKVIKQIAKSFQRLFDLRLCFQILHDPPIASSQLSQLANKERIWQVTHIEQQFHVARRAELVPKAQDLNAQGH